MEPAVTRELALFPLQTVLFPGGRLPLQVFEARYLDLMGRCLRENADFGIVNLVAGHEVRRCGGDDARFAAVGVTVRIEEVDMPRAGLMLVSLLAQRRFRLGALRCGENGLWTTQATDLPDDPAVSPAAGLASTVATLRRVLEALAARGARPPSTTNFDDAGWVAHRWAELLPVEPSAKQAWLELDDPQARLAAVARLLADQGLDGEA